MGKIIYYIVIIGIVLFAYSMAFAQNGPVATGGNEINVPVGATATQVIPPSGSNLGWLIHVEGTLHNIRCRTKIPNIILRIILNNTA